VPSGGCCATASTPASWIAGFNGGLFARGSRQLLDDPELIIGDAHVREVIDALCWTQPVLSVNRRDTVGRRRISYRELGVEQLGSIYEGLLSFEPQIAGTPKVRAVIGHGQSAVEQIIDADRVPDGAETLATYPPGTFYLFEATGQRKGSGSFYTPRRWLSDDTLSADGGATAPPSEAGHVVCGVTRTTMPGWVPGERRGWRAAARPGRR
jgi:hypothetical protein